MLHARKALTLSLVAGLGPQALRAQAADALPPFVARVESVLERGSIEGYDVSIARFESALAPAGAIAAARREWSASASAHVLESAAGGWRVVSRWDAEGYRTLQLRLAPGGGSEGLVSVWHSPRRAAVAPEFDPAQLLPPGARVLRRFASVDAGRRAASVVAHVEGAPEWVAAAIDEQCVRGGFEAAPVVKTPRSVAKGSARLYRNGAREALVTLHPHLGRTGVVVHLTEQTP